MGVGSVGSSGVSPAMMARLGEEDRRAIRESQAEASRSASGTHNSQPQTPSAPSAVHASSPREAVQAIHSRPLPRSDDLSGLSWSVQQAIYQPRIEAFNDDRADDARDALERFAPRREDYAGLNPATANAEYREALAQFNADPYVRELRRIETEATTQRSTLPSYLTQSEPRLNTSGISVAEMRDALGIVGVELPADATPEQIDAGFELLASMPQSLAGTLINSGWQVSYNRPVAGLGTSPLIPVGARASLQVEGEVSLTDGQVGIDFESTQRLAVSLEFRGSVEGGTQRTLQQRIYGWAKDIDWLTGGSLGVKDLVESSPLLRNAVRGLPISISYEHYTGARLSYEAVVTPEQGQRIDDGDLSAAPNPLDPLSMPEGTAVLIRGQSLVGSNFDVGYKLLRVGTGHVELEGQGFGVRRTDGSTVEIYAGPVSTVENELFFGLGRGGFSAGLMVEQTFERQQTKVATLDLSTEEGRAAYQAFISSGQVPGWSPPGVPRAGTQQVYNSEHAVFLGVNAGGLTVGVGGPDSNHTVTTTTWHDGRVEQVDLYTLRGVTSEVRFERDSSGNPVIEDARWRLMVPDSHPALASYLASAYGPQQPQQEFDGEQHVLYSFTSEQLMDLRDHARQYVREVLGEDYLQRLDAGEIYNIGIPDRELAIAHAKTPEEVFMALEEAPEFLPEDLLAISLSTGEAVPGRVTFRDAGN